MKLKIILPVKGDYEQIEQECLVYLRQFVRPETELFIQSLTNGYSSVESEVTGIINGAEVIPLGKKAEQEGFDGVFVNCFDDPGVYACREFMKIPVVGAYQPSMLMAMGLGERIGIITTDRAGILSEERKARLNGYETHLAAVTKVDMQVQDVLSEEEMLLEHLTDACVKMWEEQRINVAVLGCTGMYYLTDKLRSRLKLRKCDMTVIEPMACATVFLEQMVHMGYKVM
ncbi:MAG: aspartate/glutamate racemase family protein [Lachnospiraceae bacterium]|nr:aspartate/glutamate racemase family protein [Lachnospiraceae bacterium]